MSNQATKKTKLEKNKLNRDKNKEKEKINKEKNKAIFKEKLIKKKCKRKKNTQETGSDQLLELESGSEAEPEPELGSELELKSKLAPEIVQNQEIDQEQDQDQETENHTPKYYNNTKYNLEIKKSLIPGAGLGVFALEKIPGKTHIGNYEGKKTRKKTGIYYFELNDKLGIDAIDYPRCYLAMINDSYKSDHKINCEFIIDEKKKRVEVHTIVDIDAGSELFVSYGDSYWI
jgi:hypothetical protein